MPEAVVDHVVYIPHRWFKVFLRDGNRPLMIHWNWICSHGSVYPDGRGFSQTALKPGDKIRFEPGKSPYHGDKENIYVMHLEVVDEVNVDVSI